MRLLFLIAALSITASAHADTYFQFDLAIGPCSAGLCVLQQDDQSRVYRTRTSAWIEARSKPVDKDALQQKLRQAMWAIRDAKAAPGKFSVVVYATSLSRIAVVGFSWGGLVNVVAASDDRIGAVDGLRMDAIQFYWRINAASARLSLPRLRSLA